MTDVLSMTLVIAMTATIKVAVTRTVAMLCDDGLTMMMMMMMTMMMMVMTVIVMMIVVGHRLQDHRLLHKTPLKSGFYPNCDLPKAPL